MLPDGSMGDVTNDATLSGAASDTDIASPGNDKGLAIGVNTDNLTITASGASALQMIPPGVSVAKALAWQYTTITTQPDGRAADIISNPALGWNKDHPRDPWAGRVDMEVI